MNRLILVIFFSISFCLTGQRVLADQIIIGILKHDINVRLKHRYEKGYDVNLEYLFGEEYEFLRVYPHIGAVLTIVNMQVVLILGLLGILI